MRSHCVSNRFQSSSQNVPQFVPSSTTLLFYAFCSKLNFIHVCIKKEGKLEAPLSNVLFWGVVLNVQKNGKQSWDGPIKVAASKQNKTNFGPMHPHHVKLSLVR